MSYRRPSRARYRGRAGHQLLRTIRAARLARRRRDFLDRSVVETRRPPSEPASSWGINIIRNTMEEQTS